MQKKMGVNETRSNSPVITSLKGTMKNNDSMSDFVKKSVKKAKEDLKEKGIKVIEIHGRHGE